MSDGEFRALGRIQHAHPACYNFCMTKWRSVNLVAFSAIIFSPLIAFAGNLPKQIVSCSGAMAKGDLKACTLCDLAVTAQNILNTAIYILIILSAVFFAWAGFKMLFSGGDTSEYAAGKRVFKNVVIGLLIIMCGWLIVDTVMKTLIGDKQDTFGPWNQICKNRS